MRRPNRLRIGLASAALLLLVGLALWLYWCFDKAIRYPASFRGVIEHEFEAQLALPELAAASAEDLTADQRGALDLPEILEATTWRSTDSTTQTGRLFVLREKAKKRYSWLAWSRNWPSRSSPALNLWMTPDGDLIQYDQVVEVKGGRTLGYTLIFDADLLEQRKEEYEAR